MGNLEKQIAKKSHSFMAFKSFSEQGWKIVGACKKGWYKLRANLKI